MQIPLSKIFVIVFIVCYTINDYLKKTEKRIIILKLVAIFKVNILNNKNKNLNFALF